MIKQLSVLSELETLVQGDTLDNMSSEELKHKIRDLAREVKNLKYFVNTKSTSDISNSLIGLQDVLDRKTIVDATQYSLEMYDSEFFKGLDDRVLACAIANFLIDYFRSKGQQPQTSLWSQIR